jgi:rfaE bifunctional protein nucleotidyltransferase chain/domain
MKKFPFQNRSIRVSEAKVMKTDEFDINLQETYRSIVWINGCFDLLHHGHLRTVKEAVISGDCVVIGVNSDESVRSLKGEKRPILTEIERAESLASIPGVDFVVIFKESSPLRILEKINPHIVIKDEKYKNIDYPEKRFLLSIGCEIRYMKHRPSISSSVIESRIINMNSSQNV